jgi:hypothetical protein
MLRNLVRIGLSRGFGGSRAWLAVGLTAGGLRLLKRVATRTPEVVYCEPLLPGEALTIRHLPPEH